MPRHQTVNELDADESLLALDTANSKRIYSNVYVNDQKVRFLLDCGGTVNLLCQQCATLSYNPRELHSACLMLKYYRL